MFEDGVMQNPNKKNTAFGQGLSGRNCHGSLRVEAGSSGLIDQAMMNGVESQFEAIGNSELVEDIV
jgi:hypothetical protein